MRLVVALLALVLAGCAGAPVESPEPPPPVIETVPCPAAPIVNAECKATPTDAPATKVELEDAYDDLSVSNTSCHRIVVEYDAEIRRCLEARKDGGERD